MLHTTADLEAGDLFINKYFSASFQQEVLQVWWLDSATDGEGFQWFQVCYVCASDHVLIWRNC